jgi:DNA gyrase/topoisomerase IV subunit B
LCPGLKIRLNLCSERATDTFVYYSDNGIRDLLQKKVGTKEIIKNQFNVRKTTDTSLFDISLSYTSDYSENITAYVNYGLT